MLKTIHILKYITLYFILIAITILAVFFVRRHSERDKQLQIISDFENRFKDSLSDHTYIGGGESDYIFDGQIIAILRLDRLKIKVSIAEGIEKDILKLSAGHFTESDMPGEGNFSIAGHSSMVYTCLFNDLHKAVIGDSIIVTTKNKKHEYIVSNIMVIDPYSVDIINTTNESILTIVTCTNNGKERLIIRGIEI